MKKKLIILFIAALWAVALGLFEQCFADRAGRMQDREALAAMPGPEAAATVFLGGFKALLIDALWVRGDLAFREGRFYELWPTLEFIAALQPRNPMVQEYTAWQMAYNISLAESDSRDGWTWIRGALDRLEEAAQLHPRRASLRTLRGRIFFEKCDRESFPAFHREVLRWQGRDPLDLAALEFEAAMDADFGRPTPAVFAVSCYLRMEEQGIEAGERLTRVLHRLQARHPDVYRDLHDVGEGREGGPDR